MLLPLYLFFFFNDTATTEIYTLSLHDALPISSRSLFVENTTPPCSTNARQETVRSEEHTSELQSQFHLVCRLLLEKKKKNTIIKQEKPNNKTTAETINTQSPTSHISCSLTLLC